MLCKFCYKLIQFVLFKIIFFAPHNHLLPNMIASNNKIKGVERLVSAIQELSLARSLEEIMLIVRHAARELTGADGATFVLRDGEYCYYAEEEAISPLWKGSRFPLNACISGWAMNHKQAVIIEDIYVDDRIPIEAYKPTFVKSLTMVPIRTIDPIGAIGNYWAHNRVPTDEELTLLQSLADITAVSIENVNMYAQQQAQLKARTQMLEQITEQKQQLEEFCQIIAHNMRAPLSNLLLLQDMINQSGNMDDKLLLIEKQGPVIRFMNDMFDNLVDAMQVRKDFAIKKDDIDIAGAVKKNIDLLQGEILASGATIKYDLAIASLYFPVVYFESLLFNLISNALKFRDEARKPEILIKAHTDGSFTYIEVHDNGLGIDMDMHSSNLFKLRKTFHSHPNSKGFGLFITKTQIEAMGGKIWAESTPGQHTAFKVKIKNNVI